MGDDASLLERTADRVSPPADSFDRLVHRRERAGRRQRVMAGVAGLILAGMGGGLAWLAVGGGSSPGSEVPDGHYLLLPEEPSGPDGEGFYTFTATTNLPEGTVVYAYTMGEFLEGGSCCDDRVVGGEVPIRLVNNSCWREDGELMGSLFELSLTVAPDSPFIAMGRPGGSRPSPPPYQPAQVRAILGDRLENLTGDQVTQVDGVNRIEVRREYQLPAETCTHEMVGNGQVPISQPPA